MLLYCLIMRKQPYITASEIGTYCSRGPGILEESASLHQSERAEPDLPGMKNMLPRYHHQKVATDGSSLRPRFRARRADDSQLGALAVTLLLVSLAVVALIGWLHFRRHRQTSLPARLFMPTLAVATADSRWSPTGIASPGAQTTWSTPVMVSFLLS